MADEPRAFFGHTSLRDVLVVVESSMNIDSFDIDETLAELFLLLALLVAVEPIV